MNLVMKPLFLNVIGTSFNAFSDVKFNRYSLRTI